MAENIPGSRSNYPFRPGAYTVATAPDATVLPGAMIYVSDGKVGSPIIAFSNGTNWIRVDDGATAIAAS